MPYIYVCMLLLPFSIIRHVYKDDIIRTKPTEYFPHVPWIRYEQCAKYACVRFECNTNSYKCLHMLMNVHLSPKAIIS